MSARPSAGSPTTDGFDADLATEIAAVVEHLNHDHADTVLMLARSVGHGRDLVDAELLAVDQRGVVLAVGEAAAGPADELRLDFAGHPETFDAIRAEMFGLLAAARTAVGDSMPPTSLEKEISAAGRLPTVVTSVVRTADVSPNIREVTFAGGLAGAEPLGADQYFYLAVPHHDGVVIAPGFSMGDIEGLGPEVSPAAAYYTVRRWRPDSGEIDMWFVRHADGGGVSGWAARAEHGDAVAMWGPRRSFDPPPRTSAYLLVADETGMPAVAAILEELGAAAKAQVVLETIDPSHRVDLPTGPEITVTWTYRGDDVPGTGDRLLDAVRALGPPTAGTYAFGAAESRPISAVRAHLRREVGMPGTHVRMTGYWRRAGPVV